MITKRIFFAILILSIVVSGITQNANPSVGGECIGIGGVVSYSIGQVFYTTMFENTGSVVEGVQQSFVLQLVNLQNETGFPFNIQVHPNPTDDYLIVWINSNSSFKVDQLQYQFYDLYGKQILCDKISEQKLLINVSGLSPATYILKILQGSELIKTFKIILH